MRKTYLSRDREKCILNLIESILDKNKKGAEKSLNILIQNNLSKKIAKAYKEDLI